MSEALEKAQMAQLLADKGFRLFLWRVIQTSGIHSATTTGADSRYLADEGRRSLGLDILRDVARGQPGDDPEASFSLTLIQVLREHAHSNPQEKPSRANRSRYQDESDDADG